MFSFPPLQPSRRRKTSRHIKGSSSYVLSAPESENRAVPENSLVSTTQDDKKEDMRGQDEQQLGVFSYVSPEQRIPHDHPLRQLRVMADEALRELKPRFSRLYAKTGRPSIAPEKLLRALLLQVLYSVRSERMLMEQYRRRGGCCSRRETWY